MPQIDNDELGRRVFQLQKEKAVESALEKMRHTLGNDWCLVTPADCEALKEILGESWTAIERSRWNAYKFASVSRENILKLATLGHDVRSRHHLAEGTRREFEKIMEYSSGNNKKK